MDMHKQNLTMAMMDVWSVCRADINIMDAHRAASGYSPHMPVPIESHMILGSKDPVAIDRVACEVTGIDTTAVDYFKVAEETVWATTIWTRSKSWKHHRRILHEDVDPFISAI